MDKFKFFCTVDTNYYNNPICLDIKLNDKLVFSSPITAKQNIEFDIDDVDDGEYVLKFVVYGKDDSHVNRDNDGNVTDSTEITISNISFDEININNIIALNPLPYKHNFNGNADAVVDKFYDTAGCNGEIELKFTTPIYLWLLENM